jgi:hypothetical protein
MTSAWLAAVLALSASAAEAPALPDMAVSRSTPGWSKQGKSLVLYDAEGSLAFEIGLLREDSGPVTREVRGDASPGATTRWTGRRKASPSRSRVIRRSS